MTSFWHRKSEPMWSQTAPWTATAANSSPSAANGPLSRCFVFHTFWHRADNLPICTVKICPNRSYCVACRCSTTGDVPLDAFFTPRACTFVATAAIWCRQSRKKYKLRLQTILLSATVSSPVHVIHAHGHDHRQCYHYHDDHCAMCGGWDLSHQMSL